MEVIGVHIQVTKKVHKNDKRKSAYGKDLHGVKMSKIAGEVNFAKRY